MFAAHQKLMMVLHHRGIKFIFAHSHRQGLNDTQDILEKYSQIMMDRLQKKPEKIYFRILILKEATVLMISFSIKILTKAMHTDLQIH